MRKSPGSGSVVGEVSDAKSVCAEFGNEVFDAASIEARPAVQAGVGGDDG
jgi:hypothetical protein